MPDNSNKGQKKTLPLIADLFVVLLVAENKCLKHRNKAPYTRPIEPGKLLKQITQLYLPAPVPPLPILNDNNVTEPPLPSVSR